MSAEKLPGVLARRFPNAGQPKMVMTDRGQGFSHGSTGKIAPEYKAALDAAGLRAFQGECAVDQPGRSGDVLLHETAVGWLRERLLRAVPAQPWNEGREAYLTRLREQCAKLNEECEVELVESAAAKRPPSGRAGRSRVNKNLCCLAVTGFAHESVSPPHQDIGRIVRGRKPLRPHESVGRFEMREPLQREGKQGFGIGRRNPLSPP